MDFREKKSWMLPPEPITEDKIAGTYTADVVVVGAGHSGTAASRAAREAGASVIVVEQQKGPDIHVLGNQFGSFNSEFVQSHGVPEYDPIDLMRDWQHRSLNRANPELIKQYAYHAGDTFDWFIDPLPQAFKDAISIFMHPKPKRFEGELNGYYNFIGTAVFDDHIGLSLADAVHYTHRLIAGQGVEFHFNIEGEQLETDGGRITALVGRDRASGDYYRFKANKGVILAAGDFSNNREMVIDLLDEFTELTRGGDKHKIRGAGWHGKGIRMGIWAGGRMEPAPRGGMWCSVAGNGGPMEGTAFLKLNGRGRRFTNEGIMGFWGAGAQGARQPPGAIRTIWDANWRDELECQTLDHSSVDISDKNKMLALETDVSALKPGPEGGKVCVNREPEGSKRIERSFKCYAANTIEELAGYLRYEGEDKQRVLESVARYNELCTLGRDEDFAKDPRQLRPVSTPPFYGFIEEEQSIGFLMVSVAGLWVDGQQRVLDDNDEPIPGLYATGNCSGGRFPIAYTTPIAGVSIGIAYTLGRIVGHNVASK